MFVRHQNCIQFTIDEFRARLYVTAQNHGTNTSDYTCYIVLCLLANLLHSAIKQNYKRIKWLDHLKRRIDSSDLIDRANQGESTRIDSSDQIERSGESTRIDSSDLIQRIKVNQRESIRVIRSNEAGNQRESTRVIWSNESTRIDSSDLIERSSESKRVLTSRAITVTSNYNVCSIIHAAHSDWHGDLFVITINWHDWTAKPASLLLLHVHFRNWCRWKSGSGKANQTSAQATTQRSDT